MDTEFLKIFNIFPLSAVFPGGYVPQRPSPLRRSPCTRIIPVIRRGSFRG